MSAGNSASLPNYRVLKHGSLPSAYTHSIKGSLGGLVDTSFKTGDVLEKLTQGYPRFNYQHLPLEALDNDSPERFFWIHDIAVTSDEGFGYNRNRDAFPGQELEKYSGTFFGGGVFDDHNSDPSQGHWDLNHGHVFGVIFDVARVSHPQLAKDACHTETLMLLDICQAERVKPGMIAQVENGIIQDTSMGVLASHSTCAKCGAKILDVNRDPCSCLKNKESRLLAGMLPPDVYELVWGPMYFFENTIITTGALTGKPGGGADVHAKMHGSFDGINVSPYSLIPLTKVQKVAAYESGETQRRINTIVDKFGGKPSRFLTEYCENPKTAMSLKGLSLVLKTAGGTSFYSNNDIDEGFGSSPIATILEDNYELPLEGHGYKRVTPEDVGLEEISIKEQESPKGGKVVLSDPQWVENLELPIERV